MNLSNLQALTSSDKCLWLQSPEGIEQLKQWFSAGYTISRLARMININEGTLYKLCDRNPAIVAITGRTLRVEDKGLSRPSAYRLVFAYKYSNQQILAEYEALEELWADEHIKQYFAVHGVSELDYLAECKKRLESKGIYRLSHMYHIIYGDVGKTGSIIPRIQRKEVKII